MKNSDWFPGSRAKQLEMMTKWEEILRTPGTIGRKIEPEDLEKFAKVVKKTTALYHAVQSKETRTPVVIEECREAFKELQAAARAFKAQYLSMPPLTPGQLVSLWLKVPDRKPTPLGPPTARVAIEPFLRGDYELGIRFSFVVGDPADPANKGIRVYYSVVGTGEEPPKTQDDLRHSFLATLKKDYISFSPEDAGKTCYMAAQIENKRKKGQWGPMTSKMIPG